MPTMVWNTANNQNLLIYLLASNPQIKLDFEGAAKMLTNKEQHCTARAVQEHFKKMKRIVMEDPKWAIKAEQAAAGHGKFIGRRGAKALDDDWSESDNAPEQTTPAPKKITRGASQSAGKVKAADQGTGQPAKKKQKISQ